MAGKSASLPLRLAPHHTAAIKDLFVVNFGAAFGRGGLEDTSSSLKTISVIQRETNDGREANEILRSGSESPADRS